MKKVLISLLIVSLAFLLAGCYGFFHTYVLNLEINPEGSGTVTGSGNYEIGQEALIEATPETGYVFVNWTLNGNPLSSSNPYTYIMTDANITEVTIIANFQEEVPPVTTYSLTVVKENGTVITAPEDTSQLEQNASVTLMAIPDDGYEFVNWTRNGNVLSTNLTYTFTMPDEDVTIFANFQLIEEPVVPTYSLFVNSSPTEAGTVLTNPTNITEITKNATVILNAISNQGYEFDYWSVLSSSGLEEITDNPYTFNMPEENLAIIANFQNKKYNLNVQVDPVAGGTVTTVPENTSELTDGATVTLTATADTGYEFVNWTKDGNILNADSPFIYTMPATDVTIVANFQEVEVPQDTLALKDLTKGNLSETDNQYNIEDDRALFGRWTVIIRKDRIPFLDDVDDFALVLNGEEIDFVLVSGNTYRARFLETLAPDEQYIIDNGIIKPVVKYNLTLSSSPLAGGSVSGAGSYKENDQIEIEATPNTGYEFVNWTIGTNVISNNPYTFNMPNQNLTIVANFQLTQDPPIPEYTLTVTAVPSNGGTVSGGGSFEEGQSFTVLATVNPGFEFLNWTRNGNVVSTNLTYTSTMPNQNKTLVANFNELPTDRIELNRLTKGDLSNPNNQYNIEDDRALFGRWTVTIRKDRIDILNDKEEFFLEINGEVIDFIQVEGNLYRARFLETIAPNEQYITDNGIIIIDTDDDPPTIPDSNELKDLTKGDLSNPNNQYNIEDDRALFGRWTVTIRKDRIPYLDGATEFTLEINGEEFDFVQVEGNLYRARFLETIAPNEQYITDNGVIKIGALEPPPPSSDVNELKDLTKGDLSNPNNQYNIEDDRALFGRWTVAIRKDRIPYLDGATEFTLEINGEEFDFVQVEGNLYRARFLETFAPNDQYITDNGTIIKK